MDDNVDILHHLQRLRAQTVDEYKRTDLMKWLCDNTTIGGLPFSTKDHEYQERIGSDDAREIVVRKCSQVGISELSIRIALGLAAIMRNYHTIYTFPTATFSAKYVKTRVDPVIQGSSFLRAATSGGEAVDSSEVKKIGDNYVYFNGAATGNAAISVAADNLIHDELDFSDQVIISQYTSRLTHSRHKNRLVLSTPTVPDGPIDKEFRLSRRHWNICKCNHCSHYFVPDYYEHVKVPGFDDSLEKLTKENLHKTRYKEAQLLCPKCGKVPSLQPQYRGWVCENPDDDFLANGYQVQPFDAPNLIALPSLIETSTKYERVVDFKNFSLGLPAEDSMSGMSREELERCLTDEGTGFSYHVLGADMGLTCHVVIGGVDQSGKYHVVHMERVPVDQFRKRYVELCTQYRVTVKVIDTQPYVETVLNLQSHDSGLFGALFSSRRGIDLFDVKKREADDEMGVLSLRQVDISKGRVMDKLLDEIHEGNVLFKKSGEWEVFVRQMRSMKRTTATLRNGEFQSSWVKTDGNDHYHMALLYFWVAAQMRFMSFSTPTALNMGVRAFQMKRSL